MNRKKELKEQYRQMKPDMGIFMIRSKTGNKCYLESAQNLIESKTDYTDDLALLQMIWEEKLAKEGLEFYKKRVGS